MCSCTVTRVSLSDWLAFQARIRGSKDPRLLRDRPSDGAAMGCENHAGMGRIVYARAVAVRAGLCGFKLALCAGYCWGLGDHACSQIMRCTMLL